MLKNQLILTTMLIFRNADMFKDAVSVLEPT